MAKIENIKLKQQIFQQRTAAEKERLKERIWNDYHRMPTKKKVETILVKIGNGIWIEKNKKKWADIKT